MKLSLTPRSCIIGIGVAALAAVTTFCILPVGSERAPDLAQRAPSGLTPALPAIAPLPDGALPKDEPVVALMRANGATSGKKLVPGSADYIESLLNGMKPEGRITPMDRSSFNALIGVTEGDQIEIPLAEHEMARGTVNLVQQDSGRLHVAGELKSPANGSFAVSVSASTVAGLIQLPAQQLAYRVEQAEAGDVVLREMLRSDVVCSPLPLPKGYQRSQNAFQRGAGSEPPILNSRPNATSVLYLDFDGEVVTDPAWNNGTTINAPAARLNDVGITDVWRRVSEDFSTFDINVTTELPRYDTAGATHRMRCIITANDIAASGAGGVAYVNSFTGAANGFTANIPCWVFIDDQSRFCAEAVSHEFGHTLGLIHDGRISPPAQYYAGHGSGQTSWAPIMGVGYDRLVVQWSKGEYTSANNKEDDLAIISRAQNGFGYVPDDVGNNRNSPGSLSFSGTTVNKSGLITSSSDVDFYAFSTTGGLLALTATGGAPSPNLDIIFEVQNSTGGVIQTSNNPTNLAASLSTNLAPGGYFLVVRSTGVGTGATGYTTYASIGQYTISGQIEGGGNGPPFILSSATPNGEVDKPFSYQIVASNDPTSYGVTGTLPDGLTFNETTGIISGTPTVVGNTSLTVSASNAFGVGEKAVTLSITPTPPPNLVAYQPEGWTDEIVVSNVIGTNNDSAAIESDDDVYIDFAIRNQGSLPALNNFTTHLFVDDEYRASFETVAPLAVDAVSEAIDLNIGRLPFGPHVITIRIDVNENVAEVLEDDNEYSRTIFVTLPTLPNLAFQQPPGWTSQLVVSNIRNTTADKSIVTTDTVYVDFAVINNGLLPSTGAVMSELYVDDTLVDTFASAGALAQGIITFRQDINLGSLSEGAHTIAIKTDANDASAEIDESDNMVSRTIVVGPAASSNLAFFRPPGWSDDIVLSRVQGTRTDSPTITTGDTIYLDFSVANNGSLAVSSAWKAKILIDEVEVKVVDFPAGLPINSSSELATDIVIPPLAAGPHTIQVLFDADSTVGESDESPEDNTRTRVVTVIDPSVVTRSVAYTGLIRPTETAANPYEKLGLITVKVNSKGAFTAKFTIGKSTYNVKGALGAGADAGFGKGAAQATALIKRKGSSVPLALDLRQEGVAGSEQLLGDLTEGGLQFASISADRVIYSGSKNPVPPLTAPPAGLLGRYTVLFPPKAAGQLYPQGTGVATLDVLKTGVVRMSGTLADGAKFSFAGPLVTGDLLPMHLLAGAKDELVNGPVSFREVVDTSDIDATSLRWIKLENPRAPSYRSGWAQGILVDFIGSKYLRPKNGRAIPWLPVVGTSGNADFAATASGLPGGHQEAVLNIDDRGRVIFVNTEFSKLKLKLNVATGLFSGSCVNGKRVLPMGGAIFDRQEIGRGFVIGDSLSGPVTLDAISPIMSQPR